MSPYLFTTLTFAPSSKQSLTAAKPLLSVERVIPGWCPTSAATIRGVVPPVVVKDRSAPCATNSRITSREFAQAASRKRRGPGQTESRIGAPHVGLHTEPNPQAPHHAGIHTGAVSNQRIHEFQPFGSAQPSKGTPLRIFGQAAVRVVAERWSCLAVTRSKGVKPGPAFGSAPLCSRNSPYFVCPLMMAINKPVERAFGLSLTSALAASSACVFGMSPPTAAMRSALYPPVDAHERLDRV